MTYIPLPEYLEGYANRIANFSLLFQKFFPYDDKNLDTLKSVEGLTGHDKYNPDINLIKKKNAQQDNFLKACYLKQIKALKLKANLLSRLVAGIGETTPVEVGMVFDRNIGIPYIPASSIKGAVAYAYCVNYVTNSLENDKYIEKQNGKILFKTDEDGFKTLFGSRDTHDSKKGGFCFLDAYPESKPQLVVDIMNPHFSKYYAGEQPPVETESPIPIKFLAVEKDLVFNFNGYFRTDEAYEYKDKLVDAFITALGENGLGAKTAAGYGKFCDVADKTGDLIDRFKKELDDHRREEEKRIAKEEKMKKREQEKVRKQKEREQKQVEEDQYRKELAEAEGIDRDILLLQKGNITLAHNFYDKYLKGKDYLSDEKEIKIAELVMKFFSDIPKPKRKKKRDKKAEKKYEKRVHVEKLIASS